MEATNAGGSIELPFLSLLEVAFQAPATAEAPINQ